MIDFFPPMPTSSKSSFQSLVLKSYSGYFFIAAVMAVLGLFFWVISPFTTILILASFVAAVFAPLNQWFYKVFRKRAGLSALLSTIIVLVLVVTPLALFTIFLTQQALDAYDLLDSKLMSLNVEKLILSGRLSDLPWIGDTWKTWIEKYGFERVLGNTKLDFLSLIQDLGQKTSTFLVGQSAVILRSVGDTAISVLIFLMTLFFFFRDGKRIVKYLESVSPLPTKYENEIVNKLKETTQAIVVGNFGTAIFQGFVGGIGLAIAGVHNVIFWGTLMAFASLIPYFGAGLIWFPVAVFFLLQGSWGWGIFMLIWGTLVSTSDNFVRPYLIGSRINMHPLATFLVVLGGIFIFGLKGIVFGPLILSLTVTILHLYQMEYRNVLKD